MEIGNFTKCALLTGAGWSHNWGARLAAGVWQLVMDNSEVAANDRLRTLLLAEPSFELALAKTQVTPFTTGDREQFKRALVDAFVSMDRAMTRPFDGSPGTINIYKKAYARASGTCKSCVQNRNTAVGSPSISRGAG
jgi:hypothetical protein